MIIYAYSSKNIFSMENIALVERIISIIIVDLDERLGIKVDVEGDLYQKPNPLSLIC